MLARMPAAEAPAAQSSVIFIGASTGGTEAIKRVLSAMPADSPPILIVQHMPERFTAAFAQRLDQCCAVRVKEAEDGERVFPGRAYVAPGHSHLRIRSRGGLLHVELSREQPYNRHRPAVDLLFFSAASAVGARATGVLLTGMGKDGAEGLLAMRRAGAYTVVQDEASCVVFGMPREAVSLGAAAEVVALPDIATRVRLHAQRTASARG